MSRRATSWLAWSACTFSLTLSALSVLLIVLLLRSNTPIYYFWLETSMVTIGYSTVGAIVASRLPESPIGWFFCAIAFNFGLVHFSAEYAVYALLEPTRLLPASEVRLANFLGVGFRPRACGVLGFAVPQRQAAQCPLAVVRSIHRDRAPTGSDPGGVISRSDYV